MSRIKGKGTVPERRLEKLLRSAKIKFERHPTDILGKPDILIRKKKITIFIHGCFWHGHEGCRRATIPETNRRFWKNKIGENRRRDSRAARKLRKNGWAVLTFWTCSPITSRKVLLRLSRTGKYVGPLKVTAEQTG